MMMLCNKCKNLIMYKDGSEGEFVLRKAVGNAYESIYLCNSCLKDNAENYYKLEGAYPVMVNVGEK